jgi:hypothetical protein
VINNPLHKPYHQRTQILSSVVDARSHCKQGVVVVILLATGVRVASYLLLELLLVVRTGVLGALEYSEFRVLVNTRVVASYSYVLEYSSTRRCSYGVLEY